MTLSIRSIIRELLAPKQHRLSCSKPLWDKGLKELRRRGNGKRESGAFLLGTADKGRRRIERFVFYDVLEPNCLDTGAVVLNGSGYGTLWQLCSESGLTVVADIHTHPAGARQSHLDKANPMIALKGHIALIVPYYAREVVMPDALGIYEYMGAHQWEDHSGKHALSFFYIGIWG